VTWRSKLSRASGIGISGFSVTRKSSQEESRNSETRRPHSHSVTVEDRCYPYRGSGLGEFRELVQRESRYPDT
jgi:hypothetical protein